MSNFTDQIGEMTNTTNIENLLMAMAYWLVVIIILIFVFLVAVKISNFIKHKKGTLRTEKDDFLH